MKRAKVIMDFDGTLTDEAQQARELASIAKRMLAEEVLQVPYEEIVDLYDKMRGAILARPHKYHWMVNGVPATYAYEGAYLLNTSILQNIVLSKPRFIKKVRKVFPANNLDSVTQCSNHLFHTGTLQVDPHFLDGVRELLIDLIEHEAIDPVILTNSETRKIEMNLRKLRIGKRGSDHDYKYEIDILGDTRQYHMDSQWEEHFEHDEHGSIQELPVNKHFSIDLRRPVYHAALVEVLEEGHDEVVVVADGFSLAGALPLMMGLKFILKKTGYTPRWCEECVSSHHNGDVVGEIEELKELLFSLVE